MERDLYKSISSKQAGAYIIASQIGVGLLLLPSSVVKTAGRDGWISVLISGIVVLIAELISIALCKRFCGSSLLDINKIIFGKYIAFFLNLLLLAYFLFSTIANLSLFTIGVGIWFFKSTPQWVLTLYLLLPSLYIVQKGIKAICRFNFIIFLFIPLILSLMILNSHNFRISELFPVGSAGIRNIISSLPKTTFAFMGFETLLFIFPYIKEHQKVTRYTVIAVLTTVFIYTSIVITSIGVFGEHLLEKRYVAIIGLSRMLKLPILERVDLYYLSVWVSGMVLVINSCLFLSFNTAKKLFKIKSRLIPLSIICIIVVVCVSFLEDISLANKVMEYDGYASFIIGALIPIILLIIALISRKRGKVKA